MKWKLFCIHLLEFWTLSISIWNEGNLRGGIKWFYHEVLLEFTIEEWVSYCNLFFKRSNHCCCGARGFAHKKNIIDITLALLHVLKRKISYNDRDIVSKAWKERNEEEKTLSYGVNPCQICVCIMNMSLILYEDIT